MRGLIAKQALGLSDFSERMTDIFGAKVSKGERSIISLGRAFCQQIPDLFKWSDQLCPITHSHVVDLMACICLLRCRTKQIGLHRIGHVTEFPTRLSIPTDDRQGSPAIRAANHVGTTAAYAPFVSCWGAKDNESTQVQCTKGRIGSSWVVLMGVQVQLSQVHLLVQQALRSLATLLTQRLVR